MLNSPWFLLPPLSVLETNHDHFCSNVDEVGSELAVSFAGSGGLSLKARMDIANQAQHIQEYLEKIEAATKVKFELEVDYLGLLGQMNKDQQERMAEITGEMVKTYLEVVAGVLERKCADEMNQEALVDLCTAKKINFKIYKDDKEYAKAAPKSWTNSYSYGRLRVVNGVLFIELSNDRLYSNVYDVADNFDDCFSGTA